MTWAGVIARTEAMIARVAYKPGYRLVVRQENGSGLGRPYVQVKHDRVDPETGRPSVGHSERAYLPENADDTRLARLLFDLLRSAEDAEAHRSFRVDGRRVFSRAVRLDDLIVAADAQTAVAEPDPAPSDTLLLELVEPLKPDAPAGPAHAPRSLGDAGCSHKRTRRFPTFRGGRPAAAVRCLDCDSILEGAA